MDTPNFQDSTIENTVTALEERQQLLAHHVRLVARKHNHALFVFGAKAGSGRVDDPADLDEEGIEPILINQPHHAAGVVHDAVPVSWGRDDFL